MTNIKIFIISSVLIFARSGTTFQLDGEIDENEFAPDEWPRMGEIFSDDPEDRIQDDDPERVEWDDEFSMRKEPPGGKKDITLDVYYESMCPYSRRYIINQVEPACSRLKDYVHVNLLPFGNALMKTTRDGNMEVHCQHGLNECIGNKIHACGIKRLSTNQERVRYIACVMKSPDPLYGGRNCSAPYGLNWEEIESCSEGDEGDDLHYRYGEETTSLAPPIKGVPTTSINKSRGSDSDQKQIREDLFGVLCQKLREMSIRPRECGYRL